MELKQNSWFARKYLQCYSWQLPNTVCGLVSITLAMTLMYAIIIAMYAMIVSAMSIVAYHGFEFDALNNSFDAGIASMIVAGNLIGWTLLVGYGVLGPLVREILNWQISRRDKYEEELDKWNSDLWMQKVTSEQFETWYATSKYNVRSPVKSFFKTPIDLIFAVYTGIKDKTCVIINWK